MSDRRLTSGSPEPLGVTPTPRGINVAIFSAHARQIDVCLFDAAGEREIARIPLPERTGDIWHGHIDGVQPGARYGLRAHGPYDPLNGHRFNPFKLLVDPHAVALDRRFELHPAMFGYQPGEWDLSFSETDSASVMPKAIVTAPDRPLAAPRAPLSWDQTILYELNVRGFSRRNPAIPEAQRGTFAGLAHPASIRHLADLGVTSVEVMPIAAWIDERHLGPLGLTNAWGYNPVALAAPELRLAPGGWAEIRAAVDALHAAGIEVIVDVVLNHTGEGDELGPTVSLRGLDNASYYRLNPNNPARYIDDMGCGNCLALDRPQTVRLAMDALRSWVRRAGVDGFRFDLATAMGRRPEGFDPAAPLLTALQQDPELRGLKLIAEPWDIGPGGYQPGRFPAGWGEWNDRYRDDVRRFWRGDSFLLGDLATRIAGSSDLFAAKSPGKSINYIVAHDGFTLADLVSHVGKHNFANGEHNRDGVNANHSWNHGVEGFTDDPAILAARRRDQINLLATLLLSRGTPMLAMGAEMGHSQAGNNNAYAQDNALSWLDWSAGDAEVQAATRALIGVRRQLALVRNDRFLTGAPLALDEAPDACWLRPDGALMTPDDWGAESAGTLILALAGDGRDAACNRAILAIHRGDAPVACALPPPAPGMVWSIAVDTARPAADWGTATVADGEEPHCAARSVTLFAEVASPDAARKAPPLPNTATIDRLAAAAGISADWWDLSGTNHAVPPATKHALLSAMGVDVSSKGAARDALEAMSHHRQRRRLPETLHGREGQTIHLPVALSDSIDRPPAHLTLLDDAGGRVTLDVTTDHPRRDSFVGYDGRICHRAMLDLPRLPAGRYRLIDERDDAALCRLTVAPRACYRPEGLANGFGISAQLYTLRSAQDQGIGDLTTLANAMQRAGASGAATFGINPLHALFPNDRERASPYHPSDRRFLDPVYIDVTALDDLPSSPLADALLTAAMPEFASLRTQRSVDYARVSALKLSILNARFEAFRTAFYGGTDGVRRAFLDFVEQGGAALDRFAAFRVLESTFPDRPWQQWPDDYSRATTRAVRDFADQHQQAIACEMFLQWLADRQLAAAAAAGQASGLNLGLYRDLAVGCAPDGAEAWAEGQHLAHGVSVGAPPDPFSASGQIWNLPPPNPLTMAEGGFAGWRGLLAANMRHAGVLRIDHVMGLTRLFWVPDGASATEGAYISYPRDALLAELALESQRHRCMVVGEDLGTVPEGFREALADTGVLSYRVLWFERRGSGFAPARDYPAAAVACVSTHDLATLAGWWSGTDIVEQHRLGLLAEVDAATHARRAEQQALVDHLIGEGLLAAAPDLTAPLTPDVAAAVHRMIAATPALLAFAQADDLAGETEAVNLPGTDRERPNWRRRLAADIDDLFAGPLPQTLLNAIGAGRGGIISLPSTASLANERHDPPVDGPPAAVARPADAGVRPAVAGAGAGTPRAG